MTALAATYDVKRKEGALVEYAMAAVKIYKGALVSVTSSTGYVSPAADTSGTVFVGVAYETVDNSAGSAGAQFIRVQKTGVYLYNSASAAQTDIGKTLYVVDDNTCKTASTSNNIPCGQVQQYVSATQTIMRIDGKVA